MLHCSRNIWKISDSHKKDLIIFICFWILLYLLLSLASNIYLYLCYTLLVYECNFFSLLIRSKINNLIDCCLSLHFVWILYFALRESQYGEIELNPGLKYFSIWHWNQIWYYFYIRNPSWFLNLNMLLSECLAFEIVVGKKERLCEHLRSLFKWKSRWIWPFFLISRKHFR